MRCCLPDLEYVVAPTEPAMSRRGIEESGVVGADDVLTYSHRILVPLDGSEVEGHPRSSGGPQLHLVGVTGAVARFADAPATPPKS